MQSVEVPLPGAVDPLGWLAQRAVVGVERVTDGVYERVWDGRIVRVTWEDPVLTVTSEDPRAFQAVRTLFDADTDLDAIQTHLAQDPWLAPLVRSLPPPRVMGGWSGFELAARAILGQQVSVARACALSGRLVERCGSTGYPTAAQVAAADLADLGMPGARVRGLQAVARAVDADPTLFHRGPSVDATVARWTALSGVGPWTANYVAMRACREPDAFPASDVGLLRGAAVLLGHRPRPAELEARAEAWRPFRAYAAQLLWAADARAQSP